MLRTKNSVLLPKPLPTIPFFRLLPSAYRQIVICS